MKEIINGAGATKSGKKIKTVCTYVRREGAGWDYTLCGGKKQRKT